MFMDLFETKNAAHEEAKSLKVPIFDETQANWGGTGGFTVSHLFTIEADDRRDTEMGYDPCNMQVIISDVIKQ